MQEQGELVKCQECKFCDSYPDGERESFGGHGYMSSLSYNTECRKGYSRKFKPSGSTSCKGFRSLKP